MDLLAPVHLADPWPDYACLRDNEPICWHEPTGSWLISRYEHVRPLLNDDRLVHMALRHEHFEQFRGWYTAFVDGALNIAKDESRIALGLKAKQEFGDYIFPLISERRARPGQDLVSQLCWSEANGRRLDDEETRTLLALMLTAGAETTDPQLAATLHALIEHTSQLHELHEDRSLMDGALAEGMRYCAIVRFVQRIVREDFDLDGTTFREGTRLLLLLSSANRDPRCFADPDRFDIHRTDNAPAKAFGGNADHLGFGGGRHSCIGARLAKREMEIALNLLLDHAEDIQLTPGYQPNWAQNALVRTLDSLPISYLPV
jgi:pulcherriminic acid synthase